MIKKLNLPVLTDCQSTPQSIGQEGELDLLTITLPFWTKNSEYCNEKIICDEILAPVCSSPIESWILDTRCDSPTLSPPGLSPGDPTTPSVLNKSPRTENSESEYQFTGSELVEMVEECLNETGKDENPCVARCDSLTSILPSYSPALARESFLPLAPNKSNRLTIPSIYTSTTETVPQIPKSCSQSTSVNGSYITSKKMFGDHGWLGFSPEENVIKEKLDNEKQSRAREKTSMMGKLRNKLGELAALYSIQNPRLCRGNHANAKSVTISLGPGEQSKLFMEVDFTIIHTANAFLMKSFLHARLSVDSIKEVLGIWRRKGNLDVSEFMYDQAIQQELVSTNRQNLRFHGKQAGNHEQISIMLSNWKKIVRLMEIRTFCTADTVILKMLFDTEHILEFLGANDAVMFRMQEIRNSVVKNMRLNYQPGYAYV